VNGRDVYVRVCARAAALQARLARERFEPVRAGRDAEAVHDLRVASRRLRAALSLLEAGGVRKARAWRKAVRRVTRALGRARDLDVQIEFLREFRARRRGTADLDRLRGRLEARRRRVQKDVLKALERVENSGVLDAAARGGASGRVPAAAAAAARGRAAFHLRRRLDDLLALAPFVSCEDAAERHHRLRIAAKRLRYALEVFLPVFGRSMGSRIRAVKELQEILGDLHDCDVWIASLPAGGGGLAVLRADRARQRRTLYRRFTAWWNSRGGVWEWLRQKTARPR
jgi:CHAD domain-containing protein